MNEKPIGMGHGVVGRFLGLPDAYALMDRAKVVILPVPFDRTSTFVKGSDKGPSAIIEASRHLEHYDIETRSEVYRVGIHTAPPVLAATSEDMVIITEDQVSEYLKHGKFVVTLGGEHAISPAAIRAHAKRYPGLTVLQLDAHADLQPAYEGNPLSHASAMSRVKEIPEVSQLVAVGIRSLSREELPYIENALTYFAHEIWDHSNWVDRVLADLSQEVYITLDLDVFDPSILPSTGTPEPGGLGWYPVLQLLRRVAQEKTVVGFDVVELCPKPCDASSDFLAAKLIYKLLSYIFVPTQQFGGAQ